MATTEGERAGSPSHYFLPLVLFFNSEGMAMNQSRRILLLLVLGLLVAGGETYAFGLLFGRTIGNKYDFHPLVTKTCNATILIHDELVLTYINQRFFNNSNTSIEALYVVPLPPGAFITRFAYWINGQKFSLPPDPQRSGQQVYDKNISWAFDSAVSVELGETTFKLSIPSVEPQAEIRFEFNYSQLLSESLGSVRYSFPLKALRLGYLPIERVSVAIDIITDRAFASLSLIDHGNTAVKAIIQNDSSHYHLALGGENYFPDNDIAISFSRRDDTLDCHAITFVPRVDDSLGSDGYYGLWVTAPEDFPSTTRRVFRSIVFAAEISRNMKGERLAGLKNSLGIFLDELQPEDRFNIVAFNSGVSTYAPDLVDATPQEIASARTFVAKLSPNGGEASLDAALARSLAMSYKDFTEKITLVMTSSPPYGGETYGSLIIDSAVGRNRSHVHIYTFGVGDLTDAPFLEDLAAYNSGFLTRIPSGESISEGVRTFFEGLDKRYHGGAWVDVIGLNGFDLFPSRFPYVRPGKQLVQFGRYSPPGGERQVRLTAEAPAPPFEAIGSAFFNDTPTINRELARFWAKEKIDLLLAEIDRYGEHPEILDALIRLGMRYNILTRYTTVRDDPAIPSGVDDRGVALPIQMMLR